MSKNDMQPEESQHSVQTEMMMTRQSQEVQVAMLAAKKFPRDELQAIARITKSCQRKQLADNAIYSYPRGKETVAGPSIRLAEAIAQGWGNIESGIIELDRANGSSTMMAYAWDLETNTRDTKIFTVKHWRDTKKGGYELTDERDIYEIAANYGARRKRACILSVIPADVVEMATKECKKTLSAADSGKPVNVILTDMLKAFKKIGVTKAQIEKYMDKKAGDLLREDLVDLGGVYKAISDGHVKVEAYFEKEDPTASAADEAQKRLADAGVINNQ